MRKVIKPVYRLDGLSIAECGWKYCIDERKLGSLFQEVAHAMELKVPRHHRGKVLKNEEELFRQED